MQALSYVAAALIGVWGIAHAVPTKRVVAGVTPITVDNRRVLIQEWLAESCTMWGMAALVVVVTATAADTQVIATVYRTVAGLLVSLAVLTALTGARTPIVWFKVCPVLLATSAALSGKVRRNYPSVLSKETNVEPKETSAESNPPPCSSVSSVSLSLGSTSKEPRTDALNIHGQGDDPGGNRGRLLPP